MKQPLSASEASQKPETGAAPGTEDLLDVLASRIDQLAASDSEDDIFSGMYKLTVLWQFLMVYILQSKRKLKTKKTVVLAFQRVNC